MILAAGGRFNCAHIKFCQRICLLYDFAVNHLSYKKSLLLSIVHMKCLRFDLENVCNALYTYRYIPTKYCIMYGVRALIPGSKLRNPYNIHLYIRSQRSEAPLEEHKRH